MVTSGASSRGVRSSSALSTAGGSGSGAEESGITVSTSVVDGVGTGGTDGTVGASFSGDGSGGTSGALCSSGHTGELSSRARGTRVSS